MAMRRRAWIFGILSGLICATLLVPYTRCGLRGWIAGEHFYRGLPSSYWGAAIQDWYDDYDEDDEGGRSPNLFKQALRFLGFATTRKPQVLEMDPAAIGVFLDLVERHQDGRVRSRACISLGLLHDTRATTVLEHALAMDQDSQVRRSAAQALGFVGDRDAVPVLAQRLREEPCDDVRSGIGRALGEIGGDDAVKALQSALNDKSDDVRESCELSLERLGKLQLPLPEETYRDVTPEQYAWYAANEKIKNSVEKNGTIYFEVVYPVAVAVKGGGCGLGSKRLWYRLRSKSVPNHLLPK
jgi:hypothetical protein